jgi:hypothetical protein
MNENTELNRRKIILFDSWTKGSRHIFRHLEQLDIHNIDIKLVHVGSWGDEIGRPNSEVIKGLKVHDINYYKSLENVIKQENPDLVLFLSMDPLIHRAFNRYCQKYKVPTLHLYHGVHSVFKSLSADHKQLRRYLSVLFKNIINRLGYVFFVYCKSLINTGANLKTWISLFLDVYKKILGIAIVKANSDAVTSCICVFNEFDQKQAVQKFSVSSDTVKIVGSPDILKFKNLEKFICRFSNEKNFKNKSVVYIGTGVRGTKMMLSDDREYFNFLMKTYEALKQINKKLILKLHYSRILSMQKYFSMVENDIIFCEDDEFIPELEKSCGAIVEPSTAALVPLMMGKPIYLAQYDSLSGLEFGEIISSYPKAFSIKLLADLARINAPISSSEINTNQWIKSVCGPLPAGDMPIRVVSVIDSLITKSVYKIRVDQP